MSPLARRCRGCTARLWAGRPASWREHLAWRLCHTGQCATGATPGSVSQVPHRAVCHRACCDDLSLSMLLHAALIRCRCNGVGHWSSNCPNQGEGGGGAYGGAGGGFAGSRYKGDGGSSWGGAQGGGGAYGGAAGGKSGACFKVGRPQGGADDMGLATSLHLLVQHLKLCCRWTRPSAQTQKSSSSSSRATSLLGRRALWSIQASRPLARNHTFTLVVICSPCCIAVCVQCGEDGHWSKDCPNQGGGGGGNYGGGGGNYGGGGAGYGGSGGKSGGCFKVSPAIRGLSVGVPASSCCRL